MAETDTDASRAQLAGERVGAFDPGTYRALYENIPHLYFTVDVRGVVRTVSDSVVQSLGYLRTELEGCSSSGLVHPDDLESARRAFESAVRDPGTPERFESRLLRKDGGVVWVREINLAFRSSAGEVLVLAICEDVTESKRAGQRIERQERELRALSARLALAEEEERRRISQGLHDDVGQNLAIAKLRLGGLPESRLAPDDAAALAAARELIQQAIEATRSLTFELGSPVLFELGLAAALRSLALDFAERGRVRVHFESDGESDGGVRCVPEETSLVLYRIARELLHNVAKYARASEVTVSLSRRGDALQLGVEDDGVGFEAAGVGRSFSQGGGFGLFSIRQQLEHLGGRLEVVSSPGRGTCVQVLAPLPGSAR